MPRRRPRHNPIRNTPMHSAGIGVASAVASRVFGPWAGIAASAGFFAVGLHGPAVASLAGVATETLLEHAWPTPEYDGAIVPGGRVLSAYGNRPTGSGGTQFHLGVDLAAPTGTPVYSPISGVAVGAYPDGELGGYGNTVVIARGDIGLLFAHLSEIDVVRGAEVVAGQQIGRIGSTNSAGGFTSSPPHTHFEVLWASDGDTARAFTRFHGGSGWYPERKDPAAWVESIGARLV